MNVGGVEFDNPVGVAAGFDKAGGTIPLLEAVGAGHIELGTVTKRPYWPESSPSINYNGNTMENSMGFPNAGPNAIKTTVGNFDHNITVGANIGTRRPLDNGGLSSLETLSNELSAVADYITVNVSTPNTEGVREMQDHANEIIDVCNNTVPHFIKLANDVPVETAVSVASVAGGVVLTNTVPSDNGGMSGSQLMDRSIELVKAVSEQTDATIIGCGGISTRLDVGEYLHNGANLVQVHTAVHTEGIEVIRKLTQ